MADEKTVTAEEKSTDFMSLVKFDATKKVIIDLVAKSKDLKIDGIDDKDGLKAVHEAQMVLRKIKTDGENKRESFVKMLNETKGKVNDYHSEIYLPVVEEEARLKQMKEDIKLEKERLVKEAEDKEKERCNARGRRLTEAGMVMSFDGQTASFLEFRADKESIKTASDEDFEKLVDDVVTAKTAETARLADEEKKKKEEDEKRVRELKEIKEKKAEQDKKELELKTKEDNLNAEKNKIENDAIEKKRKEDEDKRVKDAEEKAKKETEERLVREAKEKADKEAEEKRIAKEKAAKNKAYTAWLAKHSLSIQELSEPDCDHWVVPEGNTFTLNKKVDTITIK